MKRNQSSYTIYPSEGLQESLYLEYQKRLVKDPSIKQSQIICDLLEKIIYYQDIIALLEKNPEIRMSLESEVKRQLEQDPPMLLL